MKLNWNLTHTAADGRLVRSGTAELRLGENHVLCTLPAGTLESAAAELHLTMDEDEKVFMNGYQTWTYCPERRKWDKIRSLHLVPEKTLRANGYDRYGDYHFVEYPNRPGITHGFSYCYFRRGKTYRLFASLDELPGYTMFRYDAGQELLTIERDCAGVKTEGDFHAFDLYYAEGTEDEVFDGWFAALGVKPLEAPRVAGYSSWYNRYQNIDEAAIASDLAGCKGLLHPGDLFQIDDGWEPAVGDWLQADPAKFPGGLKPMVEQIHAAGFSAGLWLAPFVAQNDSALCKEHPDWLLLHDGESWDLGSNWGGFCALDIDHPGVQDYLRRVFDRVLNEWGFDLVKLDFLYGAAPFGNERESRAARMSRAMDFIRELCGSKQVLGCGVPLMPAFGKVEYCRISCDVSLDWDEEWYMQYCHRERVSTKQALGNTIFRRQLNGRAWKNDPDVFLLRQENNQLTQAQKVLLGTVNALLGDVFLTSDDPGRYGTAQREMYETLRALRDATDVTVCADDVLRVGYTLNGQCFCLTVEEEPKFN